MTLQAVGATPQTTLAQLSSSQIFGWWALQLLDPVSGTLCRSVSDISVTVSVLPTSQNLALQKVISGHHHLNLQLLINHH